MSGEHISADARFSVALSGSQRVGVTAGAPSRATIGPRAGSQRGKIRGVGGDELRQFQDAFARLCVDAALRERWRSDRAAALAELGLASEDRVAHALGSVAPSSLDTFATALFERRWRQVERAVPATARVWPALREACRRHDVSAETDEGNVDATTTAHRSPALRALLRLRRPLDAQLRRGDAPPWLGDLFSFEVERALAREAGEARELECTWPAHELACACARGELPASPQPGTFRYRMVADQLFVRGA